MIILIEWYRLQMSPVIVLIYCPHYASVSEYIVLKCNNVVNIISMSLAYYISFKILYRICYKRAKWRYIKQLPNMLFRTALIVVILYTLSFTYVFIIDFKTLLFGVLYTYILFMYFK